MFQRNINFTLIFVLISCSFLLAQGNTIKGKPILKGIWKNHEIEYVKGEVAVILKTGSAKADI